MYRSIVHVSKVVHWFTNVAQTMQCSRPVSHAYFMSRIEFQYRCREVFGGCRIEYATECKIEDAHKQPDKNNIGEESKSSHCDVCSCYLHKVCVKESLQIIIGQCNEEYVRAHESNVGNQCSRVTGGRRMSIIVLNSHVHPQFLIACAFVAWRGGRIRCAMCTSFTCTHQRCCAHTGGRQGMQKGMVRGVSFVNTLHKGRQYGSRGKGTLKTNFTVRDKTDTDKVSDECDIEID